jgi:hypothetical protein
MAYYQNGKCLKTLVLSKAQWQQRIKNAFWRNIHAMSFCGIPTQGNFFCVQNIQATIQHKAHNLHFVRLSNAPMRLIWYNHADHHRHARLFRSQRFQQLVLLYTFASSRQNCHIHPKKHQNRIYSLFSTILSFAIRRNLYVANFFYCWLELSLSPTGN